MEKDIVKDFNKILTSPDYSTLREELTDEIDFQKIKLGGLILKDLRKKLELSQKSFGEKLHKKQNTILKYEIGALKINLKTWHEIIKIFNINYDLFVNSLEKAKSEIFPYGCFSSEKIANIILSHLPKEHPQSDDLQDITYTLILDFVDDKINEYTKELLNKVYPFIKSTPQEEEQEKQENKSSTILDEVKKKIEFIDDEEQKKIEKIKLKKIEKDIENYTIFLLKQNDFI